MAPSRPNATNVLQVLHWRFGTSVADVSCMGDAGFTVWMVEDLPAGKTLTCQQHWRGVPNFDIGSFPQT